MVNIHKTLDDLLTQIIVLSLLGKLHKVSLMEQLCDNVTPLVNPAVEFCDMVYHRKLIASGK